MKDTIIIKPIKLQEYTCKQSKHDIVPKLPLRGILLAPSGSGKTVLLSNLILNVYRDCFERIYIFSPSVDVDLTWQAVKDYQEKVMKVKETEKEKLYFDHYNSEDLQNIIDTQHKVILHMKNT
jgi:predicted AAA+ superfamily ATPase